MIPRNLVVSGAIVLAGLTLAAMLLPCEPTHGPHADEHDHGHEHGTGTHDEVERGPHGGRLLHDPSGFAIEVTIYENGVPPQSRVYPYQDSTPIPPSEVSLTVELQRFDRKDVVQYKPEDTYLIGDKTIEEPHSFDVSVKAQHRGTSYSWSYPSYEGRVEISAASAARAEIVSEPAGPQKIKVQISRQGIVKQNADTTRTLSARYSGVVRELRKQVGDTVQRGDVVAVIESNDSLTPFDVLATGSGSVIEKRVSPGETVSAGAALYGVADLRTVWVDVAVHSGTAAQIRAGQPVEVTLPGSATIHQGTISYISPIAHRASQSFNARAVLNNPEGLLRPGLFVDAKVTVAEVDAEVAVKRSALQTFRDWTVVFAQRDATYEIAIVELGAQDDTWAQVLSGLKAGQSYVTQNSFVVKAEIGKAGASHDH